MKAHFEEPQTQTETFLKADSEDLGEDLCIYLEEVAGVGKKLFGGKAPCVVEVWRYVSEDF